MLTLLGAIAIGSSGTVFAAMDTVSANDIKSKTAITRMHKDSGVDVKNNILTTHKKTKKHHKKNNVEIKTSNATTSN